MMVGVVLCGAVKPETETGTRVPSPAPPHCDMSEHDSVPLSTPSPAPRSDDRGFDVLSYDLDFRLDPSQRSINGRVDITLVFLTALDDYLELDLVEALQCTQVMANSLSLPYLQQDESLLISLPHVPATGDTLALSIAWEGQPPRHGSYYAGLLFRTHDQGTADPSDDAPIIASISETWSAHSWWPCKDHLSDKAIFTASITVPDTLIVVSNGSLTYTSNPEPGWRLFHWEEQFPMPTYLFSVAISNYTFWDEFCAVEEAWPGEENIHLEYFVFPQDETAAATDMAPTCRMMQMMTSLVGPYPFRGEKYAQAEIKWVGAMEHTTASSISQYLFTGNHDYENVIVHELAHHWFGNSLTPATWADIWLNEGFARYSEALWVEHAYGYAAYCDFMNQIGKQNHPQLFLGDGILADPDPILPNLLVYDKGAWVLHMLRLLIGDEVFFIFLKDYAQNNALVMGAVTTADMITAAEIASGTDLDGFFTPWLTTDLAPSLQIRIDQSTSEGGVESGPYVRVEIEQNQAQLFTMALPIRLHTACGVIDDSITIRNKITTWRYTAACSIDSVSIDPEGLALFHLGSAPVATLRVQGPTPNPATVNGADFFFTTKESGSLMVNLYDLRGHRLKSYDGGYFSANNEQADSPHLWHWNGTAAGDNLTAAGVYWLEFLIAGQRRVHKVLLLP